MPGHGWTLKKIQQWLKEHFKQQASRSTIRALLKRLGLSWKKSSKVLRKGSPTARQSYLERWLELWEQLCAGEIVLLYADEVHLHRDMQSGYLWARRGPAAYRASACAPLSERLNWYGVYDFGAGRCLLWCDGPCNGATTVRFLQQIATWLPATTQRVLLIWDGAPWHRARIVRQMADQLGIELLPLPAYSPDLNPIEGLWKWLREEVTQHYAHDSLQALHDACLAFIERINRSPSELIDRLWPRFQLDPLHEKFLLSI